MINWCAPGASTDKNRLSADPLSAIGGVFTAAKTLKRLVSETDGNN